jgi:hypothetical protein
MSERSFFSLLRSKLRREPDRAFDQRFWLKFEREFGVNPNTSSTNESQREVPLDRLLSWLRPARFVLAAGAAASLVMALFAKSPWKDRAMLPADLAEISSTGPVISSLAVIENLDLFATFDDVNLSDQEWDDLLGEKAG